MQKKFFVVATLVNDEKWFLSALHKDCSVDFSDDPDCAIYFPLKFMASELADNILSLSSKYPLFVEEYFYGREGFEYEKE